MATRRTPPTPTHRNFWIQVPARRPKYASMADLLAVALLATELVARGMRTQDVPASTKRCVRDARTLLRRAVRRDC